MIPNQLVSSFRNLDLTNELCMLSRSASKVSDRRCTCFQNRIDGFENMVFAFSEYLKHRILRGLTGFPQRDA